MKKYNFFISLCISLLLVCCALVSVFLRITLILLMLSTCDLFIIDQLPRDFEISYWKQLRDYRVTSVHSNYHEIEDWVWTYEKNKEKLYVKGAQGFWIIDYVHGNITLFDRNLTKEDVDVINSYVDTHSDIESIYDKRLSSRGLSKIAANKKVYKDQMKILTQYSDLTYEEQEIYQRLIRSPSYENTSPRIYGFLFQPFEYLFR